MSNPAFRAVQTMLKLAVILFCIFYNFLLGLGSTTKTSQIQTSQHKLSDILAVIDQKRDEIKSKQNEDMKVLPYYRQEDHKSYKERNHNFKKWIKHALSEKAYLNFTIEGKFQVKVLSSLVLIPVKIVKDFTEYEKIEKTLKNLQKTNLIWGRV